MRIAMDNLLGPLLNERLDGPTLWIADENLDGDSLQCAQPRTDLHVISNRFDIAATLGDKGISVTLCDFDFSALPVSQYARIVYRVSKERMLVHHCINESYRHLQPGGELHLLGAKEDGIKTHGKHAGQLFTPGRMKKHGNLYQVRLTRESAAGQWLDSNDYGQLRSCEAEGMHFLSKPGIFGWNKLDRGSVLLAEQARMHLPAAPGSVLDLGCGYGYLLLATADIGFSSRAATDNNATAIMAARANFQSRDMAVHVTLDNCGSQLQKQFDVILCNPPFHHGFTTSGELTERFLTGIRRLLRPGGTALLVVNQFISLERLAEGRFAHIRTLAAAEGFKVVALS